MTDATVTGKANDDLGAVRRLSASYSSELRARVGRLDEIIGNRHWLSVGTYKESLLADVLRNHLPGKFEIGTGFVLAFEEGHRVLSRQLDLLIWNSHEHAPIFRDGSFVVVPPEACLAVVEVKSTLTRKALRKAVENLDSLNRFARFANAKSMIHKAVFAFGVSKKLAFPAAMLKALYRAEEPQLVERLDWTKGNDHIWSLPWIDTVAVLGAGALTLTDWNLDGANVPTYLAVKTVASGLDNTFGVMATSLLAELMTGRKRSTYLRLDHPGRASATIPVLLEDIMAFMGMKAPSSATRAIGSVQAPTLATLLEREVVVPAKPTTEEVDEEEDEENG